MTQISKYPLDRTIEDEIFRKFWQSISVLRDTEAVASFFSDFLSDTEQLMLAKRLTIAILLLAGKRPKEIKDILHVSNSATGSVSAWLKNARPKTKVALTNIIREGKWKQFIDRFEAFLDSLPPPYRSNWSKIGKDRWKRKKERASRQSLR
jgi:uncharacterized protein YerC